MMSRPHRGLACSWLAWRVVVLGVWPGREEREGKRNRGQDESDGPLGVYAVGLVRVLACFRDWPSAVLPLKRPPRLFSGGAIGLAGLR